MPTLYPRQQAEIERALRRARPVRFMFSWSTGAGKSAAAITTAKELQTNHILVVSPAIQRLGWKDEFDKWWPGHPAVGVLDVGRERKLASKKAVERRDAAYACPIQVVSYELLGEVIPGGWDLIIIDEAHALGNPLAKQSVLVRHLLEANHNAHILMLTATPIPTVTKQLWHPLFLLEGDEWGRPTKTGDVSWEFARRYCEIVSTEYGKSIGQLRDDREEALSRDLKPIMSRLTMHDIAPNMPAINASVLHTTKIDQKFFNDWVSALETDIDHAIIFTHLKATAQKAYDAAVKAGWPVVYLDGEVPATKRAETIKTLSSSKRSLLVATYDSLSVGIRLLYAQKVVICELSSSPKTTAQVLGRFAAVGSDRRPAVQLAVRPSDETAANRLLERLQKVTSVIGAAEGEQAIDAVLRSQTTDLTSAMASLFEDFSDDETVWETEDEDNSFNGTYA